MKIKNVSVKVIGVLGHDLMPDETMDCNESVAENSAVQTMVKMGFLKIDDSEEKAKAMKEQAMAEARAQLLKEQEEATAKAVAEAANDAEASAVPEVPEASTTPKNRRATKAPEASAPAAE